MAVSAVKQMSQFINGLLHNSDIFILPYLKEDCIRRKKRLSRHVRHICLTNILSVFPLPLSTDHGEFKAFVQECGYQIVQVIYSYIMSATSLNNQSWLRLLTCFCGFSSFILNF